MTCLGTTQTPWHYISAGTRGGWGSHLIHIYDIYTYYTYIPLEMFILRDFGKSMLNTPI